MAYITLTLYHIWDLAVNLFCNLPAPLCDIANKRENWWYDVWVAKVNVLFLNQQGAAAVTECWRGKWKSDLLVYSRWKHIPPWPFRFITRHDASQTEENTVPVSRQRNILLCSVCFVASQICKNYVKLGWCQKRHTVMQPQPSQRLWII